MFRSGWGWVALTYALSLGCGDDDVAAELSAAECSDGVDNDGDGAIDCADVGCRTYAFCEGVDGGSDRDAGDVDAGDVDAGDVDAGNVDARIDAEMPDAGDAVDAGMPLCPTTLVNEGFESSTLGELPTTWLGACVGAAPYSAVVTSTAHDGARGLTVDFRGTGGEAAFGVPVEWPSSGVVDVELWVRPETTNQNIYILPVRADRRLINAVPLRGAASRDRRRRLSASRPGALHGRRGRRHAPRDDRGEDDRPCGRRTSGSRGARRPATREPRARMSGAGALAWAFCLVGCMASAPCPTPASSVSPASSQSAWTLVEEAAHSLAESRDLVELSRFAALVAETRLHAPEPTTLAPRTRELRQRLVEAGSLRVRELDAVALAATAHEPALRAWHQASFYLSLLPVAESAEETTAFQQLVEAHERVRLAVERAARLRYSQWALGEIEQFQQQYKDATGTSDDEENIIRAAARELGPIDAELLLPAIGMLYQQVLSTAAQRLSDDDDDLRGLLTAIAVADKRGLR